MQPRAESSQKALGAARNYHSDATYLIIIAAGESERATQIFTAADLSAAADCPAIRACVLIADAQKILFNFGPGGLFLIHTSAKGERVVKIQNKLTFGMIGDVQF
jgi:hypothetical protein